MATAAQLLADACTSGIQCLNKRQLLIVLAQASVGDMATANELLAAACVNGISCLDERQLLVVLAQAVNAGGGGGGAALTVSEEDGAPSVSNVSTILVSNTTLTDNGGGSVSVVTGAGGATNHNLQGVVDPTVAPADPAQTWTYTNTAAGTFWVWNTVSVSWQQLL